MNQEEVKNQHHKAKEDREIINDPFEPETIGGKPPMDPTPLCYDPGPCPCVILFALSDWVLLRTNNPRLLELAAKGRAAGLHAKRNAHLYTTDKNRDEYELNMIKVLMGSINQLLPEGWQVLASEDRFYWLTTSKDKLPGGKS